MTHVDGSERRPSVRRRDPQGTRDRLVRAALELFTTQGYHASTTPLIAERAGVAEGTIYRHFASKEALLNEIYRAGVRVFTTVIKDSPTTLSCAERLERMATSWRDVAVRNPALARLVFLGRLRHLLDARSRDALKELRDELEKVIASGKAAGHVRPGPVEVWADIWLALVTLMLERITDKEWLPDHSGTRTVIESAWTAIASRESASARVPSPSPPRATLPQGPPPGASAVQGPAG